MSDGNPLGIRMIVEDGHEGGRAYIPLDVISEEEVERLRSEHLEINDGGQHGDAPPGIKDDTADQKVRELAEEAIANPIDESAKGSSPADALG